MNPAPHVLVVDDQPDLCELVRLVLRENGYVVATAGDGRSMRDILTAETVDLVIVDAILPDESGTALAAVARRHGARVIVMSGHPDQIERLADGDLPFLAKPFRIDELLACVRETLDSVTGEDTACPS